MTDRNASLARRGFLAGASALGLASLLPASARAQGGDLVVSNWGGDWNDRIVKGFEAPAFAGSPLRIVHDLAPVPERKTKLLAERRLPRGSIDVTWLSDADAYEMNAQGVLDTLDMARIPNAAHIVEKFRLPYLVPCIYGGVVILYNPAKIPEPPTSFADLWNPKYAGRVGVMDQLHFNYIYAAALSHGGTMSDVGKAFPALLDLKKAVKPRLYPSHQALAAAFQSEEIWISANYSARAVQWQKEGLPVRWSYPKEGAVFISFGAGIPKRARNVEGAYAYLNAMLEPKPMGAISLATSYSVVTDDAEMAPQDRRLLEFTPEQVAALNFVDYAYAAKNDPKWVEWWNKEFKA
ncbi:extracellular solute-binding protein [Methylobacterium terricola]|uniref:Extracellular solute-binding protein n=1 Tax=Methylobacterium terricola TaxID=2583531 RepID=A0A5C4LJT4_9HYPH|nr:extracellular solute-binding protein [Methylobacterium terricola]TNC14491.1 extracellular solute-binding protein [Methylobacterium terricola]